MSLPLSPPPRTHDESLILHLDEFQSLITSEIIAEIHLCLHTTSYIADDPLVIMEQLLTSYNVDMDSINMDVSGGYRHVNCEKLQLLLAHGARDLLVDWKRLRMPYALGLMWALKLPINFNRGNMESTLAAVNSYKAGKYAKPTIHLQVAFDAVMVNDLLQEHVAITMSPNLCIR